MISELYDTPRYCLSFLQNKIAKHTLSSPKPSETTMNMMKELETKLLTLVSRITEQIDHANRGVNLYTSKLAIEESKKAIKQAESIA